MVKKVEYKATLKVLGREYVSKGETVLDAISNLKPGMAKGKGILTIENGGVRKEKIIGGRYTLRLFSSAGLIKDILLKQVVGMFGGI